MSGEPKPVIRVVDALTIAQERFKLHVETYGPIVGAEDNLQVAEVAALIAIAQSLRVLAKQRAEAGPDPADPHFR